MQVLPIPELMPFRLTRQMTGALQPHDALALLQTPCTLAMTALRSGKDILEVCNPSSPLICWVAPLFFIQIPADSFFFQLPRESVLYSVEVCRQSFLHTYMLLSLALLMLIWTLA